MKYFVQNVNKNNWVPDWLYRFEIYDYNTKTRTYSFPERNELITTEESSSLEKDWQKLIKV